MRKKICVIWSEVFQRSLEFEKVRFNFFTDKEDSKKICNHHHIIAEINVFFVDNFGESNKTFTNKKFWKTKKIETKCPKKYIKKAYYSSTFPK